MPGIAEDSKDSYLFAMAEIVNLRAKRKEAARRVAKQQADANAVKFGRSAAQKRKDQQEAARLRADLDGKKRNPDKT